MEYYSIPLKLDKVMIGKQLSQIDIRKSIHQNIQLMLKTLSLSYRYDPTFGCVLNKYHAKTPPQRKSEKAWRETMREEIQKNIKDLLQRYETRIKVKDVLVDLQLPGRIKSNPVVQVRVEVIGQLTLGRKEQFYYPDSEIVEEGKELFPLVIPVK